MPTLYQSKLQTIADALAVHLAAAPVLLAEECEVISKVDDTISSVIAERVGKAGGLLCIIALERIARIQPGGAGPRVRVTWNISLWARRAQRTQLNTGATMYEAILARVQGWQPSTEGLCYEEFDFASGGHVPHPKYSIHEASFAAVVQIAEPSPV